MLPMRMSLSGCTSFILTLPAPTPTPTVAMAACYTHTPTSPLPVQEIKPRRRADAGAAGPSGAHTVLSELAGSSERGSRGAGASSESQRAQHVGSSGDERRQQQQQRRRHQPAQQQQQQPLQPQGQSATYEAGEFGLESKRAELLSLVEREAPEAAALCSRVAIWLEDDEPSSAQLWYDFDGRAYPSTDELIPVLMRACRAAAASGGGASGGVGSWRQRKAGSQEQQERSAAPSRGYQPAGSKHASTPAGSSIKKRSCPPASHSSGGSDRERRRQRRINCRHSHRAYVLEHAPEAIQLFDSKVRSSHASLASFLRKNDSHQPALCLPCPVPCAHARSHPHASAPGMALEEISHDLQRAGCLASACPCGHSGALPFVHAGVV